MEVKTPIQDLDLEAQLQSLENIEFFDKIPFNYFRGIAKLISEKRLKINEAVNKIQQRLIKVKNCENLHRMISSKLKFALEQVNKFKK